MQEVRQCLGTRRSGTSPRYFVAVNRKLIIAGTKRTRQGKVHYAKLPWKMHAKPYATDLVTQDPVTDAWLQAYQICYFWGTATTVLCFG